jgi:hypothetical protein
MVQDTSIQVNIVRYALSECVRDARDHKASIAVANEDEVTQLLSFNNGEDIFHMGLQRNVLGEEMRAIPHSGEAWRENPVPASPENIGYTTPAPAPMPRTMHQDEGAGRVCGARSSGIADPGPCPCCVPRHASILYPAVVKSYIYFQ